MLPELSLEDMLLPFPEKVATSEAVLSAQKALGRENMSRATTRITQQRIFRYMLIVLVIALLCVPIGIEWIQKRAKRRPMSQAPSPREQIRSIKQLALSGGVPWTELLALLNAQSGDSNIRTAYELHRSFSREGRSALAQGATLIEQYAYQSEEKKAEMMEAIALVEQGIV